MDRTICAIATPLNEGAISIIKVSGKDTIDIVSKIFSGKIDKEKSHYIKYGYIVDNGNKIDEVLLMIMLAPKTYTREDVIEINCHGGIAVTNKILELLLNNGCFLAEPGEFTKRAYLNGRIDLVEAESVNDIIKAETENASALALNNIRGLLSKKIKEIRKQILELQANIEVNIDYPEYEDAEVITKENIIPRLLIIKENLEDLLHDAKNGKIIKNGIDIAIVGRPNVGKSSILNFLLDENKAIVTDIEGTTRDIVEGSITLEGIKLNLIDTAGIRETDNIVEKIGVEKSRELIEKSDLVILVLNNNEKLTANDEALLDIVKNKNHLIFINKNDLPKKLEIDSDNIIMGNTMELNGLDNLKKKIVEMFNLNKICNKNMTYLTNARQISLTKKSLESIDNALKSANNNIPVDMLSIDIKLAWDYLGEIIGETYKDELLDELFSNFCLGK